MASRSLESYAESGIFRVEGARAATKRLLAEHPETTALVVGNNLMTVGTLGMLRTAGLDRNGTAYRWSRSMTRSGPSLVDPPLTPSRNRCGNGAEAIDMLLQRIRRERTSSKHIVTSSSRGYVNPYAPCHEPNTPAP